jgi:hypothetical protein
MIYDYLLIDTFLLSIDNIFLAIILRFLFNLSTVLSVIALIIFRFLFNLSTVFSVIALIIFVNLVASEYALIYHLVNGVLEDLGNVRLTAFLITIMYVLQKLSILSLLIQ